ncbi:uncharacterized protein LOC143029797 [Oratosquilla oratoria]|uniref:uncharacterized protein LOC143029797 n=1 Tax=Oratosquilla oratoria TaxID=337810 RepID=UPI003F76A588
MTSRRRSKRNQDEDSMADVVTGQDKGDGSADTQPIEEVQEEERGRGKRKIIPKSPEFPPAKLRKTSSTPASPGRLSKVSESLSISTLAARGQGRGRAGRRGSTDSNASSAASSITSSRTVSTRRSRRSSTSSDASVTSPKDSHVKGATKALAGQSPKSSVKQSAKTAGNQSTKTPTKQAQTKASSKRAQTSKVSRATGKQTQAKSKNLKQKQTKSLTKEIRTRTTAAQNMKAASRQAPAKSKTKQSATKLASTKQTPTKQGSETGAPGRSKRKRGAAKMDTPSPHTASDDNSPVTSDGGTRRSRKRMKKVLDKDFEEIEEVCPSSLEGQLLKSVVTSEDNSAESEILRENDDSETGNTSEGEQVGEKATEEDIGDHQSESDVERESIESVTKEEESTSTCAENESLSREIEEIETTKEIKAESSKETEETECLKHIIVGETSCNIDESETIGKMAEHISGSEEKEKKVENVSKEREIVGSIIEDSKVECIEVDSRSMEECEEEKTEGTVSEDSGLVEKEDKEGKVLEEISENSDNTSSSSQQTEVDSTFVTESKPKTALTGESEVPISVMEDGATSEVRSRDELMEDTIGADCKVGGSGDIEDEGDAAGSSEIKDCVASDDKKVDDTVDVIVDKEDGDDVIQVEKDIVNEMEKDDVQEVEEGDMEDVNDDVQEVENDSVKEQENDDMKALDGRDDVKELQCSDDMKEVESDNDEEEEMKKDVTNKVDEDESVMEMEKDNVQEENCEVKEEEKDDGYEKDDKEKVERDDDMLTESKDSVIHDVTSDIKNTAGAGTSCRNKTIVVEGSCEEEGSGTTVKNEDGVKDDFRNSDAIVIGNDTDLDARHTSTTVKVIAEEDEVNKDECTLNSENRDGSEDKPVLMTDSQDSGSDGNVMKEEEESEPEEEEVKGELGLEETEVSSGRKARQVESEDAVTDTETEETKAEEVTMADIEAEETQAEETAMTDKEAEETKAEEVIVTDTGHTKEEELEEVPHDSGSDEEMTEVVQEIEDKIEEVGKVGEEAVGLLKESEGAASDKEEECEDALGVTETEQSEVEESVTKAEETLIEAEEPSAETEKSLTKVEGTSSEAKKTVTQEEETPVVDAGQAEEGEKEEDGGEKNELPKSEKNEEMTVEQELSGSNEEVGLVEESEATSGEEVEDDIGNRGIELDESEEISITELSQTEEEEKQNTCEEVRPTKVEEEDEEEEEDVANETVQIEEQDALSGEEAEETDKVDAVVSEVDETEVIGEIKDQDSELDETCGEKQDKIVELEAIEEEEEEDVEADAQMDDISENKMVAGPTEPHPLVHGDIDTKDAPCVMACSSKVDSPQVEETSAIDAKPKQTESWEEIEDDAVLDEELGLNDDDMMDEDLTQAEEDALLYEGEQSDVNRETVTEVSTESAVTQGQGEKEPSVSDAADKENSVDCRKTEQIETDKHVNGDFNTKVGIGEMSSTKGTDHVEPKETTGMAGNLGQTKEKDMDGDGASGEVSAQIHKVDSLVSVAHQAKVVDDVEKTDVDAQRIDRGRSSKVAEEALSSIEKVEQPKAEHQLIESITTKELSEKPLFENGEVQKAEKLKESLKEKEIQDSSVGSSGIQGCAEEKGKQEVKIKKDTEVGQSSSDTMEILTEAKENIKLMDGVKEVSSTQGEAYSDNEMEVDDKGSSEVQGEENESSTIENERKENFAKREEADENIEVEVGVEMQKREKEDNKIECGRKENVEENEKEVQGKENESSTIENERKDNFVKEEDADENIEVEGGEEMQDREKENVEENEKESKEEEIGRLLEGKEGASKIQVGEKGTSKVQDKEREVGEMQDGETEAGKIQDIKKGTNEVEVEKEEANKMQEEGKETSNVQGEKDISKIEPGEKEYSKMLVEEKEGKEMEINKAQTRAKETIESHDQEEGRSKLKDVEEQDGKKETIEKGNESMEWDSTGVSGEMLGEKDSHEAQDGGDNDMEMQTDEKKDVKILDEFHKNTEEDSGKESIELQDRKGGSFKKQTEMKENGIEPHPEIKKIVKGEEKLEETSEMESTGTGEKTETSTDDKDVNEQHLKLSIEEKEDKQVRNGGTQKYEMKEENPITDSSKAQEETNGSETQDKLGEKKQSVDGTKMQEETNKSQTPDCTGKEKSVTKAGSEVKLENGKDQSVEKSDGDQSIGKEGQGHAQKKIVHELKEESVILKLEDGKVETKENGERMSKRRLSNESADDDYPVSVAKKQRVDEMVKENQTERTNEKSLLSEAKTKVHKVSEVKLLNSEEVPLKEEKQNTSDDLCSENGKNAAKLKEQCNGEVEEVKVKPITPVNESVMRGNSMLEKLRRNRMQLEEMLKRNSATEKDEDSEEMSLHGISLNREQKAEVKQLLEDKGISKDANEEEVLQCLLDHMMANHLLGSMNTPRLHKFLRQILDNYNSLPSVEDSKKHSLCLKAVEWAKDHKNMNLRHELEVTLMTLYFNTGHLKEAEAAATTLFNETKKLQDKEKTVKACLVLSRAYHAMGNVSKARSNLTTAKTEAIKIYTPPDLQAQLDLQSGILQVAEGKDMETAFSYFKEASTSFASKTKRSQALKYMVLTKVLLGRPEEGEKAVKIPAHLDDLDVGVEAMLAVSQAACKSSLQDFREARKQYKENLEGDHVIAGVLEELYTTMMERNLKSIIKPYKRMQIPFVAECIGLPREEVERRLSQMILDKRVQAKLDHRDDCLYIYDEGDEDQTYNNLLEIISTLEKTLNLLNQRAKKLL